MQRIQSKRILAAIAVIVAIQSISPIPIRADDASTTQSNSATPLNPSNVPPRPAPLIEIGDKFFGPGPLQHGIQIPTGAVWTPDFTVFGDYRTAFQAFRNLTPTRSEWANRLDLYGNLQLTGTERILVGFRPLDDGVFAKPALAKYSGYQFTPDSTRGPVYKFDPQPTTLFFEGDLGQIFPSLDPIGSRPLDIGFSVGRQPLLYQDGLLLDDDLDAIGITRNTFLPRGGSNAQITVVYAWDQINNGDGIDHGDRVLLGLLLNADFRPSTWDLDLFYVEGRGAEPDGFYGGLSAAQRFGEINTTFRLLGSKALGHDSGGPASPLSEFGNGSSAVANGLLLFSELSYTPMNSVDIVYFDSYWCLDRFTSAARGPDRGGVLGRVGILFAEQPIGRYGSALNSDPERSLGFALGYQKFLDAERRRQLILEFGGRMNTLGAPAGALAAGARYQQAFGQHTILQFDAFTAAHERQAFGYGGRAELRFEF